MIIYGVLATDGYSLDGEVYYATKAEAMKEAKSYTDADVTVTRYIVLGPLNRQSLCNLLNGEGWVDESEEIYQHNAQPNEND